MVSTQEIVEAVLGSTDLIMIGFQLISSLLFTIGLAALLHKCGGHWWQALIPCYRDYAYGRAAGDEEEGKKYFVVSLINLLLQVLTIVLTINTLAAQPNVTLTDISDFLSNAEILMTGLQLALMLMKVIFSIRIFLSLCTLFNRKKTWVLLYIVFTGLTLLIFGCGKKFQPTYTSDDVEERLANYFSGKKAAVMDQGLTVNVEERTVRKMFSKRALLKDIHLAIQPGHMVLLLGGSGAGKTTLISAINGYEKAKAEIILNGSNVYKDYKNMQFQIGFVPQGDLMRLNDTVLNTLYDSASLRLPVNFTREQRHKRVRDVMDLFGLTPIKGSKVRTISGGQRKRLSIAMEFISNPDLFILDEPDSGLDGVMARNLMTQLREIADQGKIVIVITHTPDRVADLFDDVIVLAQDKNRTGRLAYYGPVTEARTFFGKETMEEIVRSINRKEDGGEGRAEEFVLKYNEQEDASHGE